MATMPRGRTRQFNPKIPAHIEQGALPRGLYFAPQGNGRWYRREGKVKVYGPPASAKLSELHAFMEQPTDPQAGTVVALWNAYRESSEFRDLAESTRTSYTTSAKAVLAHKIADGRAFGALPAKLIETAHLQRLVDKLAGKADKRTPSKAAHAGRLARLLWVWGHQRGMCGMVGKLSLPKEKADPRMPERVEQDALVAYARERAGNRGKKGAVAPYLWAVAEIAFLCRLRGVEVLDLSDASANERGVVCERRKGSEGNTALWSPRLRAAWDALVALREATWARRKRPTPIRAEDRPLVVDVTGGKLRRRALTLAMGKLVTKAIADGKITRRFGLHGLKHRGVTDTPGTRADKRAASGHTTEAMVKRYDHERPEVPAAG